MDLMRSDEGLTIDNELNFSKHIDKLCCNVQYKLYARRCIRKYLRLEKTKMSCNAFIDDQLCTINKHILQKETVFKNAEDSSKNIEVNL